jgi:hypothetical protein
MRHATKWNDKDLLQDEPFYSAFRGGRRRTPDRSFFGDLVKKVKRLEFGVRSNGIPHTMYLFFDQIIQTRVVQSWVDLAFARPPEAEKNLRVSVDHAILHHFVKFYWSLAQSERKALKLLNQARRWRRLGDLHPSDIPTARQMTLPAQPHRGPTLNEAQIKTRTARAYGNLNSGISCSYRVSY